MSSNSSRSISLRLLVFVQALVLLASAVAPVSVLAERDPLLPTETHALAAEQNEGDSGAVEADQAQPDPTPKPTPDPTPKPAPKSAPKPTTEPAPKAGSKATPEPKATPESAPKPTAERVATPLPAPADPSVPTAKPEPVVDPTPAPPADVPPPVQAATPVPAATETPPRIDPAPTAEPARPSSSPTAITEPTVEPEPVSTPVFAPVPTPDVGTGPSDPPDAEAAPSDAPNPTDEAADSPEPQPTDELDAVPESPGPSAEPSAEPSTKPAPSNDPEALASPLPSDEPGMAEESPLPSGAPSSMASQSPDPDTAPALQALLVEPAVASLTISAVASPTSLPEPGGTATVDVLVTNTSVNPATLTSLSDDVLGDLDGTGDCATSVTIAPGASYGCSYSVTVAGTSGDTESRTVTALLTDDVDLTTAQGSSTASVDITDLPASGTITQGVSPDVFDEPDDDATFTVRVDNTGSVDALTVQSLVHDLAGDVDGQGGCALPQTIDAGDFYECSFTFAVSGNAGDVLTPEVSGSGADSDGSPWAATSNPVTITFDDLPSAMSVEKSATPTEVSEPGGDVVFSVTVDNDSVGDEITLDSLVDDIHGDLNGQGDCGVPQDIPAGGSYSCSFTAAVTGNAGDSETDTVTADATDDDGVPLQASDSAIVSVRDVPSSISLTKSANPTEISEPGENVIFSVSIVNTSPADSVTIESITDVPFGDVTQVQGDVVATDCSVTQALGPTESYDCTFTAFVAGNAGENLTDTVTAVGTDDDGATVSGSGLADVDVIDVPPTMEVSKTAAPLEVPEPGGDVTFSIAVTNTSAEPVIVTTIGDDVYGNLNGACGLPATVQPSDTFTCQFTRTVQGDAGDQRTDIATITAQDDEGNSITAQDDATVTITDVLPSIEIDKSANPEQLPEPGGTVLFRVQITNPSVEDVELTGLVDDIHGDLNGQGTCQTPTTVIADGGTYVCSFTADVTGEAGYTETDTITVTGQDNDGNQTTDDDDATVTIVDVEPEMSVSKSTSPSSLPEPGGDYDIVVTITNDSAVDDLTVTSIIDVPHGDLNGQGDCTVPQTIPPGGSYSCSVPESLTGNAGDSESDTVTVTANDNEGNVVVEDDDATFTITDLVPVLDVDKTATPSSVPEPGGDVTFTITIVNASPEQVTQLTIEDDVYGDLDGQGTCATPVVLEPAGQPGDTYTCEFTEFVTNNAGEEQIDIVTATGQDDEGNIVEGSDSETVEVVDSDPTIAVDKSATPQQVLEPGGDVFFTISIENTSAEPVTITSIVDDVYGDLDGVGGCSVPQTIPPGGSYTCSFIGPVTGQGGTQATDTVDVTAEDDEGNSVEDGDSESVDIINVPPEMDLTKTAIPRTVSPPGGDVTYTITVENESTFDPLILTELNDDLYGDVADPSNLNLVSTTCSVTQTIPPGGTYSCEFVVFTPVASGLEPPITDTVTGKGTDDDTPAGETEDSDSATVNPNPSGGGEQTLTKTASPDSVPEPGGPVDYTVRIENDGPIALYFVLVDDIYGDITAIPGSTCAVPVVLVGPGFYECTFTAGVAGSAGDVVTDTITATGFTAVGLSVISDSASVEVTDVLPDVSVVKTGTPNPIEEPGGTVTFTVLVTNESDAEEAELSLLFDDVQGDLNGQGDCSVPQTLAPSGDPGDSYSCSFTADVFGNFGEEKTDFVIARVEDDEGNSAFGFDTETITFTDALPDFSVTKTPNPASVPEDGGPVRYTVVITNDAVEDVQITSLVDVQEGVPLDLDGQGSCLVTQTIPPGGTYTCSFTRDVLGNADTTVSDTVTATGEDDEGNSVDRTADADVLITPTDPVLTVTKMATPSSVPEPGDDVVYTVTITNDSVSTDPVTVLTLTDSIEGGPAAPPVDLACEDASGPVTAPFTMQPGDVVRCTFAGTITGNAGDSTSDTFTVTGVDDDRGGTPVTGSGSETVPVTDVLPTMDVVKTADPNPIAEPGGAVTYTAAVTNTSDESIFITDIFDDVAGPLTPGTCVLPAGGEVLPGETYECSWSGTVSGDVGDIRSNVVTVTAEDDEGNVIEVADREDTVISDVLPTFDLVKTANPTSLPEPGGNVTFTVSLTNTTVEPITVDAAVDDVYGPLSALGTCDTLVGITIVPGDTYLCTFVAPVTGTAELSPYTDTITVTVSDNDGNSVDGDASADVELTDVVPTIRLRKGRTPASLPEPGGVFTFTIRVDNQSDFEDVELVSLDDDIYGDIADPANPDIVSTTCVLPQTIAPGGRYDCSFDAEFFGDAGDRQRDVVTATANDDEGNDIVDTDPARVSITDVLPEISATKSPDPASLPEPGGDITFSVEVFNDSTVESVELTTLDDDIYGDLTSTAGDIVSTTCVLPQTMAIGGSYACEFVAPVTGTAELSPYTDTITATAVDNEGNQATADASADVTLTDVDPEITVDKTAAPLTLPEPGGTFTFSVTVTNDSVEEVTLTSLSDDIYGDLDGQGDCALPQTIAVGGAYSCSFPGDFTGNAGDGQTDTVTAIAEDDEGNTASDDDDATVTLTDVDPEITVDKTAAPLTLPEPGGTFTFSVTVTNDSVEEVTLTSLSDDIYGDLDGQGDCALPQTIAVGGAYSCSFPGDFTGNAGDGQTDTVTAIAEDDEGNTASDDDDATVTLTDVPSSIEVIKDAAPIEVPEPGDTVTFSITVENTSPVDTVTIDSLVDDVHGDLDGQGDCAVPFDLAPAETYSCSFTADVTGNAGYVEVDTVTASGTDDDGVAVSDDDDATVTVVDVLPEITVDKTAAPLTLPEPGGDFTFSVTVTNDSVEAVTLTSLSDDIYGDITLVQGDISATDCAVPQTIAVGGDYSCSFTAPFTGNAFDAQTDVVTATADDDEGNTTTDDDDATVELTDVPSSIEVTKDASPTQVEEPGDDVVFSVSIENTSDPDVVTIESITDDIYGDVTQVQGDVSATDCAVPFDLAPGETYDCTFTAFVSGNAGDIVTDTVTAAGVDDDGFDVSDDDTADVEILDVLPGLSLEKTADPLQLDEPGGEFTFTIAVTNESVEPVTLTSLSDDIYGDVTVVGGDITATDCVVPTLIAVDDTYTCSFVGLFTGNAGDVQTDVVTGIAEDDEGNAFGTSDDATVELLPVPPVISVTKTPDPTQVFAPGGDVTFTITVTNESTFEPVTLDELDDSVFGDLDGQGSCLADGSVVLQPGETYTCRFSGKVTGAAGSTHRNTVTAVASDDDPVPETASASAQAEVSIVALDVSPQQPTDMLLVTEATDPLLGGASLADLVRAFVLFLAATILVGGLGIAVVRRARL